MNAADGTSAGRVAVIVAGGGPPTVSLDALGELGDDLLVVAADEGLVHAADLGLAVTVVVGDMDSVDADALSVAEARGTRVVRHPAAKDATDLDLALDLALAVEPDRLVVVTGRGDREDHAFAVALSVSAPDRVAAAVAVEAWIGPAHLWVVRAGTEVRLEGSPGDLVSLLPMHGGVRGVTTVGLLYPLVGEDLTAGSSRGVSNQWLADEARVRIDHGVLVAVAPGVAGPPLPAT